IAWGCRIQRAAINHFVDNLTQTLSLSEVSVNQFIDVLRQRAMAAFELLRTRPTLEEANAYGSIGIAYDVAHKRKFIVGPVLRPDRLFLWLARPPPSGGARFWGWQGGGVP